MWLICLLFIAASFSSFSVPLTAWSSSALGQRLGQVDVPRCARAPAARDHARPVPNTGGIAIFISVFPPARGRAGGSSGWFPPDGWTGWLSPVALHIRAALAGRLWPWPCWGP